MIRKSTIENHHYLVKRVPRKYVTAAYPEPWVWKVYRDDYSWAGFRTYERALSYAIERTNEEHEGDWMLTYALAGNRWIMFIINEQRKIFCVLDNKHEDSMNWRKRKTHQWLRSMRAPKPFRREESGVVIYFADPIETKLKQAIRGEWVKYE